MDRVTLIPFGAPWRYWHKHGPLPKGWSENGFDDRDWDAGAAPLGYSMNEAGTRIYPGSSFKRRPLKVLLRHCFTLEGNRFQDARLVLAVHRNTSVRVYLNETPVAWDGDTNSDTSRLPLQFSLSGRLLRSGTNVVAVELTHPRPEYVGLSFDLALAANCTVLDRMQFAASAALPIPEPIAIGARAPDFEWLEVFSRKPRRLSEFLGQPFLLQFSGAECLACWKKLPIIRRWADAGLACLSISSWGTVEDMEQSATRHAELLSGIAVGAEPKAYDPQETACYRLYGIFNGSVLVGADGNVVAAATGFALDDFLAEVTKIDETLRSLGFSFPGVPEHITVAGGSEDWHIESSLYAQAGLM